MVLICSVCIGCELSDTVPADGKDNDCDGRLDEEIRNFVDDDGDGLVDEDLATTPVEMKPPRSSSLRSCRQPTNPSHAGRPVISAECQPVRTDHTDIVEGSTCYRTITRQWTSVDSCGNVANATQLLILEDKTPPTLSAPDNVTVTCAELKDAIKTGVARPHDDCDSVSMWHEDRLHRCTVHRQWFARDACGNGAPAVIQSISLQVEPPRLHLPAESTISCFHSVAPFYSGQATAVSSTLCGWNVSVAVQLRYEDVEEVTNVCDRLIRRYWVASDVCGNQAGGIQLIHVIHQSPLLNKPADTNSSCRAISNLDIVGRASFNHSCRSATLGYRDSLEGETVLRNWTAVDDCGMISAPVVQRIALVESAPRLVVNPNITIHCHDSSSPEDVGWPSVQEVDEACFDLGATRTTLKYTDERQGRGCSGFIIRHWTATSFLGHTVQADQLITWGMLQDLSEDSCCMYGIYGCDISLCDRLRSF